MNLQEYQDIDVIRGVLNHKRIAIVGLSGNELRASSFVGRYMAYHGYYIVPVNPREEEILGRKSYAFLADIPEPVDIVDVFRQPGAVPEIARDAVSAGGKVPVAAVWRHQRGGRRYRKGRRDGRRHGSLSEGRTRASPRPHALAGPEYRQDHRRKSRSGLIPYASPYSTGIADDV